MGVFGTGEGLPRILSLSPEQGKASELTLAEYVAALRGVEPLQEKARAGIRMAAIQLPNGQIGFWTVVLVEGRVVPYPHWAGEMGELEAKLRSLFPEADWDQVEEEAQALRALWTG